MINSNALGKIIEIRPEPFKTITSHTTALQFEELDFMILLIKSVSESQSSQFQSLFSIPIPGCSIPIPVKFAQFQFQLLIFDQVQVIFFSTN